MKRTNVFLPEPLIERLKALAAKKDVGMAELIRQAIEEFLTRNKT
jgi:metal-responsive CopG/Arc/MetJ family transcriptional regulator